MDFFQKNLQIGYWTKNSFQILHKDYQALKDYENMINPFQNLEIDFIERFQRSKFSISQVDTSTLLFGGHNNHICFNDLFEYIKEIKDWKLISSISSISSRFGHASIGFKDKLFIFGGRNFEKELGDLNYFDFKSKTWKNVDLTLIQKPLQYFVSNSHRIMLFTDQECFTSKGDDYFMKLKHSIPFKGEITNDSLESVERFFHYCYIDDRRVEHIDDIVQRELDYLFHHGFDGDFIIYNHFQKIILNFPLIERKGKNSIEILPCLIQIIKELDKSFKLDIRFYLKKYISDIYKSIIQDQHKMNLRVDEPSLISLLIDLGSPMEFFNTIKESHSKSDLPWNYQEILLYLSQSIRDSPMIDPTQYNKLKWINRILSITKPFVSIMSSQNLISKIVDIIFSPIGKHGTYLLLDIQKTQESINELKSEIYLNLDELNEIVFKEPLENDPNWMESKLIKRWFKENGILERDEFKIYNYIQLLIRYKEKDLFLKSFDDPKNYKLVKDLIQILLPFLSILNHLNLQNLINIISKHISKSIHAYDEIEKMKLYQGKERFWKKEMNEIASEVEFEIHKVFQEAFINDRKNDKLIERTFSWFYCLKLMWENVTINMEEIHSRDSFEEKLKEILK